MHLRACDMSCVGVASRALLGAGMVVGGQSLGLPLPTLTNENIWIRPSFVTTLTFMISKMVVSCNWSLSVDGTLSLRGPRPRDSPDAGGLACRLLKSPQQLKPTP